MDSCIAPATDLEIEGLRVRCEEDWHAAALRYLNADGKFARHAAAALGQTLPAALTFSARGATQAPDLLLAWRSPSETLLLCRDPGPLRTVSGIEADGCCIDLTHGRCVLRIEGIRGGELVMRLGGTALDPPPGGARSGRLAEVPGLTLRLDADLLLLVVDRLYADHLLAWIRLSVADLV